ncbi:hypothetical protein GQ42DRAFT_163068 [Ramicandelaber brevisporus]|nr:hypothetical protein GQ42DRAFT_163068 [Ramicandelaber brevisporus]
MILKYLLEYLSVETYLRQATWFFWLAVAAVPVWIVLLALLVLSPDPRAQLPSEKRYRDSTSPVSGPDAKKPVNLLPSIHDEPTVTLSVIVPAYNEEQRLPIMLKDAHAHLLRMREESLRAPSPALNGGKSKSKKSAKGRSHRRQQSLTNKPFTFEILLVDDGSKDTTTEIALEFARANNMPELRVLKLEINRGKGGAVTQGMLHARGEYLLFCDADGATQFSDIDGLLSQLVDMADKNPTNVPAISIASRAHMAEQQQQQSSQGIPIKQTATNESTDSAGDEDAVAQDEEVVVQRAPIRKLLMKTFHLIVYILGVRDIKDTQCGFKLFTRAAARTIFPNMHVERFIFDIEILIIAKKMRIPIAEVPVNWHEVDGSKVSIIRDSIQMAFDLLMIRLNYLLGLWTIQVQPSKPKSQ